MTDTTSIEAAAFRRLLQHLNQDRTDVQNIDLMILAGFWRCANSVCGRVPRAAS